MSVLSEAMSFFPASGRPGKAYTETRRNLCHTESGMGERRLQVLVWVQKSLPLFFPARHKPTACDARKKGWLMNILGGDSDLKTAPSPPAYATEIRCNLNASAAVNK